MTEIINYSSRGWKQTSILKMKLCTKLIQYLKCRNVSGKNYIGRYAILLVYFYVYKIFKYVTFKRIKEKIYVLYLNFFMNYFGINSFFNQN